MARSNICETQAERRYRSPAGSRCSELVATYPPVAVDPSGKTDRLSLGPENMQKSNLSVIILPGRVVEGSGLIKAPQHEGA